MAVAYGPDGEDMFLAKPPSSSAGEVFPPVTPPEHQHRSSLARGVATR